MLITIFLLIVMFVCSLEHHNTEQDTQEDQVHVSGMLYNEERRECLMTKADYYELRINLHKNS